jgi:hypothetical protein
VSSATGSFGSVSLHVGTGWRVHCHTYETTTPILTVQAGDCGVSVSIADRTAIGARAVAFARELTREAGRFAAECERLHAAQTGDQAA